MAKVHTSNNLGRVGSVARYKGGRIVRGKLIRNKERKQNDYTKGQNKNPSKWA